MLRFVGMKNLGALMRQLLGNFLMNTEARGTSAEINLRCTSAFVGDKR
jgi:hypothetical protein